MWREVWHEAAAYVGCDLKWYRDERLAYVADNRRVLRAIDLKPFNVFDFDAWGAPWEQVLILIARRPLRRRRAHRPGADRGLGLQPQTQRHIGRLAHAHRRQARLRRRQALPPRPDRTGAGGIRPAPECEDPPTLGGGGQDRREHALHRPRARSGCHGPEPLWTLNHAQEQGINGQTACPLVEGERRCSRHREIDEIDPDCVKTRFSGKGWVGSTKSISCSDRFYQSADAQNAHYPFHVVGQDV